MYSLFFGLLLTAMSSQSSVSPDPIRILEETRIALAGGRDIIPQRVEIDAVYHYADHDGPIYDHTVIETDRRLFQEREISGKKIRRSWSAEDAFLESQNGRMTLDEEMRADLEAYLCLRQLELLVLCPGAEASSLAQSSDGLYLIEVHWGGTLLAELEIDLESRRLLKIRHETRGLHEEDPQALTEASYSEFQAVGDGWMLPHRVETMVEGELTSSYSVKRWVVEAR